MKIKRRISNALFRVASTLCPETPRTHSLTDVSEEDVAVALQVSNFTMTSLERRYHLLASVRYLVKNKIEGDIVECGVWRGGSMMLVANELIKLGDRSRCLYMYDTYQGMPQPDDRDVDASGRSASLRLAEESGRRSESLVWAEASLDAVRRNLSSTGYPEDLLNYIEGKVEETIPATLPERISLLRLDTDWYESTSHELKHLFPQVVNGGVVIIDDYGYWKGARLAVDEFITRSEIPILLHRIDDTCRAFIKLERN